MKKTINTVLIHNLKVADTNYETALQCIDNIIKNNERKYICFLEGNNFSKTIYSNKLIEIMNNAELLCPDGVCITHLSKMLHNRKINRLPGPTFMLKACEYGQNKKWKHFLFGSTPETLNELEKKLKEKYPEVIISGTYSPPYFKYKLSKEKEEIIIKTIESANPDILWVGLGGPKQEYWMSKHINKINVPVMLGVGAAFNFHSNTKKWAPKIIRDLGIEWLFRLITEGPRIFTRNFKCLSVVSSVIISDYIKIIFKIKKL